MREASWDQDHPIREGRGHLIATLAPASHPRKTILDPVPQSVIFIRFHWLATFKTAQILSQDFTLERPNIKIALSKPMASKETKGDLLRPRKSLY